MYFINHGPGLPTAKAVFCEGIIKYINLQYAYAKLANIIII